MSPWPAAAASELVQLKPGLWLRNGFIPEGAHAGAVDESALEMHLLMDLRGFPGLLRSPFGALDSPHQPRRHPQSDAQSSQPYAAGTLRPWGVCAEQRLVGWLLAHAARPALSLATQFVEDAHGQVSQLGVIAEHFQGILRFDCDGLLSAYLQSPMHRIDSNGEVVAVAAWWCPWSGYMNAEDGWTQWACAEAVTG